MTTPRPGAGASVSHTYSTVGDYTVTMTVTDNSSATTVKTLKIKAVPAITVDTISVAKTLASGKYTTSTTLKIVDADGAAVSGASVGVSYTYGAKKATGLGQDRKSTVPSW